jgi:hypothetical protein
VLTATALVLAVVLTYHELAMLENSDFATVSRTWRQRAGQLFRAQAAGDSRERGGDLLIQLQPAPEVASLPLSRAYALQRRCPNDCSSVGNCMTDLGICQCPGGEQQRPWVA